MDLSMIQTAKKLFTSPEGQEALIGKLAEKGPPPAPILAAMGGTGPTGVGGALSPQNAANAAPQPPVGGLPLPDSAGPPVDASLGLQDVPATALPEQTPQFEERKNLWRKTIDKIKTDPNFKQSVMTTGLNLMRSPGQGQNGWDVASNALQAGVTTLQALRERDKNDKIAEEDRALKKRDTESAIAARDKGVQLDEKKLGIYEKDILGNNTLAQKKHDLAVRDLEETVRHNQASEGIDRTRANTYATTGGGQASAEVVKIESLAKQYEAQGMKPVDAKAKATREVMTTAKTSPANLFNTAMNQEVELWQSNFDNLGKSPDDKTLEAMRNRAKQRVFDALRIDAATGGPGIPPGQGNVGTIDRSGQDRTLVLINQAKAMGKTPDQIKQALIADGIDPTKYGY